MSKIDEIIKHYEHEDYGLVNIQSLKDVKSEIEQLLKENSELKMALAAADLQCQFQIGEVDLRDKEIESLKGKRKPEDNDILTILNNFSEVAYKHGCANDILKVIDYINWQRAEIERLTEWKDKLQDTKDELEQQLIDTGFKEYCEENKRLTDEKAELQKQVDELKASDMSEMRELFEAETDRLIEKAKRQVVKDTAKEIISLLEDMNKRGMTVPFDMVLRKLKERYGVKV